MDMIKERHEQYVQTLCWYTVETFTNTRLNLLKIKNRNTNSF